MYKNICFGKIKFPRGVIGDDGKQFVKGVRLLCTAEQAAHKEVSLTPEVSAAPEPQPGSPPRLEARRCGTQGARLLQDD